MCCKFVCKYLSAFLPPSPDVLTLVSFPLGVTTLPAPAPTLVTKSGHFTGPASGLTRARSHFDSGKMALFSTYYEFNLNFARKSIHYAAALLPSGWARQLSRSSEPSELGLSRFHSEPWLLLAWPPCVWCLLLRGSRPSDEAPARNPRASVEPRPRHDIDPPCECRALDRSWLSSGPVVGAGLLPSLAQPLPIVRCQ